MSGMSRRTTEIERMPLSKKPRIKLFSSDLDGTLLGDPESATRFKRAWESLETAERPLLVYNSGRLVADTRSVVANRRLPEPDYIIGGVGTELHDFRHAVELPEFQARFDDGWDLVRIESIVASIPGVQRQPPESLHRYKSSWFLEDASREQIDELRHRLKSAG